MIMCQTETESNLCLFPYSQLTKNRVVDIMKENKEIEDE